MTYCDRYWECAGGDKELYDCLKVLYAQTGMIPTKTALCSDIRDFYLQPRTLKQVL